MQRRFSTRDGLTLTGDVGGSPDQPAVILLHGGGQTRHSWSGAMRRLVDSGYHVINYDARGHGDSDWSPDGDYSLPALASDLNTILATIGRPAALVGASMGGMTSFYAIGSDRAHAVTALVMVDIVLRPAEKGRQKIEAFMRSHSGGFSDLSEAADAVAAYSPDRPRPADPSGLLKNLRLKDDGRLYWHWDPRMLQVSPAPEPPAFSGSMLEVCSHVTLPTLLVRGSRSDIVDDDGVAEMRRLVPQTEVLEILDAGHMVAGDKNDIFNDGVIAFLARHHPPR